MQERLKRLQEINPQLHIYDVRSDEFKIYGNLISKDTKEICELTKSCLQMPDTGSIYQASLEVLESSKWAEELRAVSCGGLDEQVGACYGHSHMLNALEWHTCSEFNVAVTEMVLLLAKREDMDKDGRIDADNVKAFYLHEGDMVEIYSDTLHFCPCEVTSNGFISIVGLQRDTNLPLKDSEKQNLLWAKNKWLIAHEENANLLSRGAKAGIYGKNWSIKTID